MVGPMNQQAQAPGGTPDRRAQLRERLNQVFSDRLMAELAFLLIPTSLFPLWFPFSPVTVILLTIINSVIIAVFGLEYLLKIYAAESRWRYFRNPWHLLDLLIVVLAVVDFLPFVAWKGGRASPILRLLRFARYARFFALTGRTLSRVTGAPAPAEPASPHAATAQVNILEEGSVQRGAKWDDAVASVKNPRETWIDAQQVSRADLDALCDTFRIPRHVLESKLFQDAFPGIDYFKDYTIFVLWDCRLADAGADPCGIQTPKTNVIVICARDYLATLCTEGNDLFDHLVEQGLPMPGESFSVRVLYAMLRHKIADYKQIVQTLEERVADLEERPIRSTPPRFLEDTFLLKKQIQKQDYNLRHFTQVLHQISSRKVALPGIQDENLDLFVLLHDEADSLSDTSHAARENLLSLIDLQLNKVSFDINRVMRLLAVITCLSLVPAIIGGLLGENLIDQPFNITIHEIFFLTISIMLIGLYVFHRKGWLR
jgi:Mg2+ and Co2+ transporter CorA